jgi:chromosome segregation ATPase
MAKDIDQVVKANAALSDQNKKLLAEKEALIVQANAAIDERTALAKSYETRLKALGDEQAKEMTDLRQGLASDKSTIEALMNEKTKLVRAYETQFADFQNTIRQKEGEIDALKANAQELSALKASMDSQGAELAALRLSASSDKGTIESLLRDKSSLGATVSSQSLLIAEKQSEAAALQSRIAALQSASAQQEEKLSADIAARSDEIVKLKAKVQELLGGSATDEKLIQEFKNLQLQHSSLSNYAEETDKERTRLKLDLGAFKERADTAEKEAANYKDLYVKENAAKRGLQDEIDGIKTRLQASFSYADVATYFKNTIEQFNQQMKSGASGSAVNYILSDMDVELKTGIAKNEKNEMIVSPPLLGGTADSYSLIKMSIRAVPGIKEAGE